MPRKRKGTKLLRIGALAQAYFATFPCLQDGFDDLNTQLGTAYNHSNLSRWRRGEREPDFRARAIMLQRVLPGVLGSDKASDVDAALDKLL